MNFFGLDIGSDSIKVVQLTKDGSGFKLVSCGLSPAPLKGLTSESDVDMEILAEAIKKIIREAKISTNNVAVALSETQVYTRVIETPPLSSDELSSAIRWEAEQYIPLPLSDVRLDYQILSPVKDKKADARMEVLLVAAPNRVIEKYLKVLKLAGLNPVLLETEIISVCRSLIPANSGTTMLVDMGSSTTELAIAKEGILFFTRSIATGGNALARAVSTDLGLEIAQAEEYKRSYGLDETKLSGKVMGALKPILDMIIMELKRGISYYEKEKNETVSRVVLVGGSARLPGLVSYLANVIGVEVEVGNPWANVAMSQKEKDELSGESSLFATAVGLAMKSL